MISIKVDIDELLERIKAVKQDGFCTVELSIDESEYEPELFINAVGIETDEPLDFGRLSQVEDEL